MLHCVSNKCRHKNEQDFDLKLQGGVSASHKEIYASCWVWPTYRAAAAAAFPTTTFQLRLSSETATALSSQRCSPTVRSSPVRPPWSFFHVSSAQRAKILICYTRTMEDQKAI